MVFSGEIEQRWFGDSKIRNVERYLIVATPRHMAKTIGNDSRHDVNILLEYCGGVDFEYRLGVQTGQVFNCIEIKRVHNLLIFSAKLWTLVWPRQDAASYRD